MIQGELGAGGMAVVYRAEDTTLRRDVAIKVLIPHLLRNDGMAGRFLREARAAGALDHPGILKIFDVHEGDEAAGTPPYIVMELIRGVSLKDFIEKRGAPLGEIVAMLGAALGEALEAAHRAGVVHRDVKPANVMITDDGRPILCDFGVARLAGDDAVATQSGMVMGTPSFMPPEQALGQKSDARADVYSLGATLYQAGTGQLPYAGSTAAVMAAVMKGEPPDPLRRNPALGGAIARIIRRAMAKEPAARQQSAAELAEQLAPLGKVDGLGERAEELKAYFGDPGAWNERARPKIVAAAYARAEAAAARKEIARALGECDRVLALEPSHEGAARLQQRIAQQGGRRKILVAAGLAISVTIAGVSAGILWGDADDGVAIASSDAASASPSDAASDSASDSGSDSGSGSASDAGSVSASASDAGRVAGRRADAGVKVKAPDAAVAVAVAVAVADAGVKVAEMATLVVDISGWCDLEIDGSPRGRAKKGMIIELPAGTHALRCQQGPGGSVVERRVELAAGERYPWRDSLVKTVSVTIDVHTPSVRVDGVVHAKGERLTLSAGPHRVELIDSDGEAVGEPAQVQVPGVACTLKSRPELRCDEP